MRIGIHLPHIGRKAGPEAIRRAAVQAEELGFADAWTSEHIIIPKGAPFGMMMCSLDQASAKPSSSAWIAARRIASGPALRPTCGK